MIKQTALTLLLSLGLCAAQAADQAPPSYDRVSLSASAAQEVENDTLVAVMYAQREGNDATRLAREVNKQVTQAVDRAKTIPAVKVQTLEYSTSPVYRKQTLSGWRVRQSIRLESRDAAALSQLIGELQEQLGVSSITYTVSPELRRQVEDGLIAEAITAFNDRAAMIAEQMKRGGYRLVEMNINNSGYQPRPMPMRTMALAEAADAPTLEAGTRQVEVRITGSIELAP
jgi:predicted secreted protein